ALIIYYFQFPFKLAFMILTFGFLLKLSIIPQESILFKIILFTVFLLEFFRLIYSILIHKKYYK
ncbi:MAG: hypothetical protein JXA16_02620, partial [Bacteroidales bacterium]|nr:hypothetical protein [Bacteroidales bacterium]